MAKRIMEINYAEGRRRWGGACAIALWREIGDMSALAQVTAGESRALAKAVRTSDVKGVILNIAARSTDI